jgi:Uma2 family endonuclease
VVSYKIGRDGPAPLVAAEVLSARTAQQRDKGEKVGIYAALGVNEYILIDPSGEFLPQRLQLNRRQPDGTWQEMMDTDGGITSQLGFRIVMDPDGEIRLLDAATGQSLLRPDEAQQPRPKSKS